MNPFLSLCFFFFLLPGWQQTGSTDDWHTHDHPGNLWKVWSCFYHHPRPGHWRNVSRYVWNDCSGGDIQPSGKHISIFLHCHYATSYTRCDLWDRKIMKINHKFQDLNFFTGLDGHCILHNETKHERIKSPFQYHG